MSVLFQRAGAAFLFSPDGRLVLRGGTDGGRVLRAETKHGGCCRTFKTNLRKGWSCTWPSSRELSNRDEHANLGRRAALLWVLRCSRIQHKHSAPMPTAIAVCVALHWLKHRSSWDTDPLVHRDQLFPGTTSFGRFLWGNKRLGSNCNL